jgi:hypothetical protein
MKSLPTTTTHRSYRTEAVMTFGIVTSGSILFCSKGVFAKLSYAHGLDPISVLNLRMMFSLPFFAAIALVTRGNRLRICRRGAGHCRAKGELEEA